MSGPAGLQEDTRVLALTVISGVDYMTISKPTTARFTTQTLTFSSREVTLASANVDIAVGQYVNLAPHLPVATFVAAIRWGGAGSESERK